MPRINGTRPATQKPATSDKKPVSTRKGEQSVASRASGGEGPSVSTRDTSVSVSSYGGGGEGVPSAPSRPVSYPSPSPRSLWSSGGGGE